MSTVVRESDVDGAELIAFQDPRIAGLYIECIHPHPQILVCVSDHLPTVACNNETVLPGTLLQGVSTSDHGKQMRTALAAAAFLSPDR